MAREMSPSEIDDFLSRNPDTAGRVVAFGNLRDSMGWDQIAMAYYTVFSMWSSAGWFTNTPVVLPIPAGGLAVSDPTFGNVVIFPDANGELRYTCNVPAGVATQINLPPYTSPTGNTLQQILDDLKNMALKVGGAVIVGVLVMMLLQRVIEKEL